MLQPCRTELGRKKRFIIHDKFECIFPDRETWFLRLIHGFQLFSSALESRWIDQATRNFCRTVRYCSWMYRWNSRQIITRKSDWWWNTHWKVSISLNIWSGFRLIGHGPSQPIVLDRTVAATGVFPTHRNYCQLPCLTQSQRSEAALIPALVSYDSKPWCMSCMWVLGSRFRAMCGVLPFWLTMPFCYYFLDCWDHPLPQNIITD